MLRIQTRSRLAVRVLHLVEHNAGATHAALAVRLQMPRFLFEYASVRERQRVKHGVQIYAHHIHESTFVGGAEIVEGLVRVRNGVEGNEQ